MNKKLVLEASEEESEEEENSADVTSTIVDKQKATGKATMSKSDEEINDKFVDPWGKFGDNWLICGHISTHSLSM